MLRRLRVQWCYKTLLVHFRCVSASESLQRLLHSFLEQND